MTQILVLGANGKTGGRVADRLIGRGVPVRTVSRRGTPPFARTAVDNGVRRLVLLSGRGEAEAARCEQVVRETGVAWTVVRASWFNQNFSEGHLLEPVLSGLVALPAGEITGPQLLTFADAAAEISEVTGREVRYLALSPEQYREALAQQGLPADHVDLLVGLFTEVLDGRNEHLSDGVRRALGREPRSFREYVQRAAATGIWSS